MEEKTQETTQNSKEEIKLLTFQPQAMVNEIEELKEHIQQLKLKINYLQMVNTDFQLEFQRPLSWKEIIEGILFKILGGQYE